MYIGQGRGTIGMVEKDYAGTIRMAKKEGREAVGGPRGEGP